MNLSLRLDMRIRHKQKREEEEGENSLGHQFCATLLLPREIQNNTPTK